MNPAIELGLMILALLILASLFWQFVRWNTPSRIRLTHEGQQIFDAPKIDVDEGRVKLNMTLNGTRFSIERGNIWRDGIKIYENGKWL